MTETTTNPAPPPIDPSQERFLSGVFAPTPDERDASDLTVEGTLPAGLAGAYLRNGPNPMYPPLGSYTYPLEGDGMIHGLWIEDGRARYRNRFVWTENLRLERAAGHALWAGLMTPYLPGPDVVPPEMANTFRVLPGINVVRHGGRLLALGEGEKPYEMSDGLDTVGAFDFGGVVPGMAAHPRIDLQTGELVTFRYDLEEPFLTWMVIAADGTVSRPPTPIDVDAPYMIHDCALTPSSFVLFVGPLQFDLDAMLRGGNLLAWKPELGMRVLVIDRATGAVQWIETDAFWVWHFANAFERTGATGHREIVVDHTRWERPGGITPGPNAGAISRAVLDLDAGTFSAEHFADQNADFSRVDDRLIGQPHRYFICTGTSDGDAAKNLLLRVDTHTGTVERWDSGDWMFGEVCFVPAPSGRLEEGFYVAFRTHRHELVSDFAIVAADDIASGPIARVALPYRVPEGLHGNWFPAERPRHDSNVQPPD